MAELEKISIIDLGNDWHVSGDMLMDNANLILNQSASFKMNGEIKIDFTDVTNVDTSALSLILEWQRRAAQSKSVVKFANLPASLTSLANLYGVEDFIPVSSS